MVATRTRIIPDPEFTDSRQLRLALNQARRTMHRAAMEIHVFASELEAALQTVPAPDASRLTTRSVQRRKARRVARHVKHAAECLVEASSAMVRTWGEFRVVYLSEGPEVRGRKPAFKVVKE